MKVFKGFLLLVILGVFCTSAMAQFKMDGKTLRNSSGSIVATIDSDGKTIRNASGSVTATVDSDGKTIRNGSGSIVATKDGSNIRNGSGSIVASMSDMKSKISGAQEDAAHVALWWFFCK